MKRIIYIVFAAASFAMMSSCGDFLDPKSQSEFIPKTVEDLNKMLLGEAYPRRNVSGLTGLISAMDDDIECNVFIDSPEAYQSQEVKAVAFPFLWDRDYSIEMDIAGWNVYDMYSLYYRYIKGANAALDHVGRMAGTQLERNNVSAQAYALRGYLYFQLVNIYGAPYNYNRSALGVPLKLTAQVEDRQFVRSTVEEVYEQVLSDLTAADDIYEADQRLEWSGDYRTSREMVQLLLSRVYLYMEEWELAAEYADKVMKSPNFALVDLNTIADPVVQTGGAVEYNYHNFIGYGNTTDCIWVFGSLADVSQCTALHFAYSGPGSDDNPRVFIASSDLIDSFEEGDLRIDHYIANELNTSGLFNNKHAYGKFALNSNAFPNNSDDRFFGMAFRLAEAYLNYAEANAMLYMEGEQAAAGRALGAINTLRARRFRPANYTELPAMDADRLVNTVREERRRELCFECHRWFDLRRYGMPPIRHSWRNFNEMVQGELQKNDTRYTLRLPHNVITESGLEQNP